MRRVNSMTSGNYYIVWNSAICECLFVKPSDHYFSSYNVVGGISKQKHGFMNAENIYGDTCETDENDVLYKLTKEEILTHIVIGKL